ncbi:MAG: PhoH family protein, partial [Mycobacteriaceae bacterium]
MDHVTSTLVVPEADVLPFLGSADANLRVLEELLTADVHVRGNEVRLSGEPADVASAERAVSELIEMARRNPELTP